MYRFFKKYISIALFALILLGTGPGQRAAADSFSLKPIRPPGFNRLSRLLERMQRSRLLRLADRLLSSAGIYEIVAAGSSSQLVIIPPSGKIVHQMCASATIKVLSANLLLFPAPFFFNQEMRIEEFAKCVRTLKPDIILLQEVWDNKSLAQLIAALPEYYSIYSPGIGYNYSGLLTLSRFAPETGRIRRYAMSLRHSLEELIAQKSMLHLELATGSRTLHLLNTHLYSAAPDKRYRPNLEQFSLLTKAVGNITGRVIVGGDMNLRPEEIETLLPANLQQENSNLPTAGYPDLKQKLDYIIAGNSSGKTVISGKRIDPLRRFSDHNPVFAEIIFGD